MLLLSRRVGESICIPLAAGVVTITVLDVRGDRVRLGIDAPLVVPVHRGEVWASILAGGNGRLHVEPGHRVKAAA